jgi:hypothetical protein
MLSQEDNEYHDIDNMLLAETATLAGTAPQRQSVDSTQAAKIPGPTGSAVLVPAAATAPAAVPGAKKRGRPKGSKDKVPRKKRAEAIRTN